MLLIFRYIICGFKNVFHTYYYLEKRSPPHSNLISDYTPILVSTAKFVDSYRLKAIQQLTFYKCNHIVLFVWSTISSFKNMGVVSFKTEILYTQGPCSNE